MILKRSVVTVGNLFKLAISLLAFVALATACAPQLDFESSEEEDRFDAALDQAAELGGTANQFTRAENECLAEEAGIDEESAVALLAGIGAEGDAVRIALGNAWAKCLGDLTQHEAFVEQMRSNLSAALVGVDLTTAEARCTVGHLEENSANFGRTIMVGTDPADIELLFDAAELCFEPDTMATIRGEAGTGPQAYGDDTDLDALFDGCEAGNEIACDLLYTNSGASSEYNELGLDCAGRGDGIDMCSPDLDYAPDGINIDQGSPGLQTLATDCEDGDMLACDLLFFVSAPGSDYESLANTCAGRITSALPNCRTRFPE